MKQHLTALDILINQARRSIPGVGVSMGRWDWEPRYPGKVSLMSANMYLLWTAHADAKASNSESCSNRCSLKRRLRAFR